MGEYRMMHSGEELDAAIESASTAYHKPDAGIPKSDLSEAVQASLDKANSALQEHQSLAAYRTAAAQDVIDNGKVDKEAGKGLSANDYTNADKIKLAGIASGATAVSEATVSGWGFTKNTGTYIKPESGIPASDLAEAVKTDLAGNIKYSPQSLTDSQKAQARQNINAAAPDGYYGDSGGVYQYSTNFIGKNAPQNAHDIVFRPTASNFSSSGWSADSISGQTATIEKIKGRTLLWNQLVGENTSSVAVPNAHKYRYFDKDGTDRVLTSNGTAFAVTGGDDMVCDLTLMFGAGNEPTTPEEFRAMFPLDYYEYNLGELISLNATGLKTNGFNQWDEVWGKGDINNTTGEINRYANRLVSENFIHVFPNVKYYLRCPTSGFHVGFYDENKQFINASNLSKNATFVVPQNVHYIRFNMFSEYGDGTTYNHDICINCSWSSIRNGEYEPYWHSTLSLPIAQYFPDGMKSAGTVYDELQKDKAINKIGKVDLGTLTWSRVKWSNVNYHFNSSTILSDAMPNINCVCEKFSITTYNTVESGNIDNVLAIRAGTVEAQKGKIEIRCDSYTDAAAFKTAMSGVYLYYELAEPVETPISPELNLTYRVDDFGTEMLLPQNDDEPVTAPMDADIIYQIDYEAQVRNNDSLSITKESMDNFIAAFNASGIGTITQTWDNANKRYSYTVTPPEPEEGGETV